MFKRIRYDVARQFRPTDPESLRREGLRLRGQGLTDRDIAIVLGMTEAAVAELLSGPGVVA